MPPKKFFSNAKTFTFEGKNMKNVTAGILIIGDEILKGQVVDTNTQYLTKKLYELGVKVEKISVLPDHVTSNQSFFP